MNLSQSPQYQEILQSHVSCMGSIRANVPHDLNIQIVVDNYADLKYAYVNPLVDGFARKNVND